MTTDYNIWKQRLLVDKVAYVKFKGIIRSILSERFNVHCDCLETSENILEPMIFANMGRTYECYDRIDGGGWVGGHIGFTSTPDYGFKKTWERNWVVGSCHDGRAYFEAPAQKTGTNAPIHFYIKLPAGHYLGDFWHYRSYDTTIHQYKIDGVDYVVDDSRTGFFKIRIPFTIDTEKIVNIIYSTKRWGGLGTLYYTPLDKHIITDYSTKEDGEQLLSETVGRRRNAKEHELFLLELKKIINNYVK